MFLVGVKMKFSKGKGIYLDADEFENYLTIDGADYKASYLSTKKRSYSPNGFVFLLEHEDFGSQVIKFSPVAEEIKSRKAVKRRQRFEREIKALKKAKTHKKNNSVIEIISTGKYEISNSNGPSKSTFSYFTMEKADQDLQKCLEKNGDEIPLNQRLLIVKQILESIHSLHDIDIYHRDIKPSNFLVLGDTWKVADLGLAAFRERDAETLDYEKELIGPRGFCSPEALNKWLAKDRYVIDEKSDVFQVAKVIGYVLQQELFTGHIEQVDIKGFKDSSETEALHDILSKALQYAKSRRTDMNTLQTSFLSAFSKKYAL